MQPNSIPSPEKQLDAIPQSVKQAFLLFVILQELLHPLFSLLRRNVSIEDVYAQVQNLKPGSLGVLDDDGGQETSVSASPGSQDSELSTSSNESGSTDRSPGLTSGVRTLCKAIVQRDLEEVSRILEVLPSLVGKRHEGGWLPLHAAVLSGHVELVKIVLACPRADVNAVHRGDSDEESTSFSLQSELGTHVDDTTGATPLHYACMIGNIEIIRLLVDHNANFKTKDGKQRKPADYFDLHDHLDAVAAYKGMYDQWKSKDEFFKDYSKFDDLVRLIQKDKYEVFERVIKRNPDLASKETTSRVTLLHVAVVLQRHRFVELLISTDKSLVNKQDRRSGNGPPPDMDPHSRLFMLAMHSSSSSSPFESSNISFAPSTVPYDHVKNAAPLHLACLVKDMDLAKMLLDAGADWNVEDSQGRKPEDLIHESGESCDETKATFARLRDEAEERKKLSGEESSKEDEKPSKEGSKASKRKSLIDMMSKLPFPFMFDDSDFGDSDSDSDDESPSKISMESLLGLEDKIGEKLVGQRGPIHLVSNAIRLRQGGWVDPDRPLTMLFLGSSGVGKTELAKQIALFLHGKDGNATDKGKSVKDLEQNYSFVRLDMSEYQERHTVHNLIGAPKSYVGYGDGGALTKPLKKNPKAIVLLDEIEKAHPDVLNTFLQVFDDGRITDSKDGTIFCKDAIFIMTSNIAGDEIKREAPKLRRCAAHAVKEGRYEPYVHLVQDFTRSIRPQLRCHLKRDEFVGRINQMVVFLPLDEEEIRSVIKRELAMWSKRAEEKHKIKMTWTDEVVVALAAFYDVNYGVRSVTNEVQRIALQLVADAHIRGTITDNYTAELRLNERGDIVMKGCPRFEDVVDVFSDFVWSFEVKEEEKKEKEEEKEEEEKE